MFNLVVDMVWYGMVCYGMVWSTPPPSDSRGSLPGVQLTWNLVLVIGMEKASCGWSIPPPLPPLLSQFGCGIVILVAVVLSYWWWAGRGYRKIKIKFNFAPDLVSMIETLH